MQVRLQCGGQSRAHEQAIVKYHDLGPVSLFNLTSSVLWSKRDERELRRQNYTRGWAGGKAIRYLGGGVERDRCDAAEGAVRCPNDEVIWAG